MPLFRRTGSKRQPDTDANSRASAGDKQRSRAVATRTNRGARRGMQCLVWSEPGVILGTGGDGEQQRSEREHKRTAHVFDASPTTAPAQWRYVVESACSVRQRVEQDVDANRVALG